MNAQGLRQAAVFLAGMHPRDRRWIRRRLPAGCQVALARLLHELHSLGPIDQDVLRDALRNRTAETTPPEPPTPDVLLAGLQGLSPAWAARSLLACAPDHLDMYASCQSTADALAIREAMQTAPAAMPARLAQALSQIVRARGERSLAGYVS